jgi:pilus assembly protein CpaE
VVKTLKVPLAIQIPSSRSVSASINKGVPIVLDEPRHPVSTAIKQLAERHVRLAPAASGAHAAEPGAARGTERRSRSLLRRSERS